MTQDVGTWLQEVRGLDTALTEAMGVSRKDHPGMTGQVVAFPYLRNGEPYAAKFRTVEGKDWRSSQGISRGLYNEDCLKELQGPIVITEGEIDCLSVIQAGHTRSVSLPDGWTENGDKRDCLIASEAALKKSPYVIVAGDADKSGAGLPKAVANILLGHEVRYVEWPEGCKDANDVLVKFGEGEVARCLTEAKTIDPIGGFITGISDLPPLPDRRVLRVGMNPYDYVLAFEVGAMSVGTGTPGAGKSTFTTFAAYHVAVAEDVRVGVLAFETHPYQVRDQLCRLRTGKPWDTLSERQQEETALFLDRHFRIVHRTYEDNPSGHNLGWLREMIYTLAVRDNCKMIVVDPWNELEHMPQPGESLTNYINFALQQIRTWAEQFDTHICVIAHPRKMMTDGKPRSPTGYDIADSAAFANKPALGFTVHQEQSNDGEEYVRVTVWKVRNTQLYGFGKGSVRLTFMPETMSYRKFESTARYRKNRTANPKQSNRH
ncbi:toprim domain-containing protein [Pseudohalocynthiibacter aestuariivivens]|uniref:Toprim domain-containing protein n=1 Tax=Pseudohalocynthiibacter aestuariivivens TaxID=1591409 RepID=A0ABV5JCS2_9RHOB|nr:toprim domain-containing protein [Pseudohalocynthiibacter aestuariivivens]MBS9717249.1 AAA family ATPase [Pseudohalocynthiibacter aestuariivivens]